MKKNNILAVALSLGVMMTGFDASANLVETVGIAESTRAEVSVYKFQETDSKALFKLEWTKPVQVEKIEVITIQGVVLESVEAPKGSTDKMVLDITHLSKGPHLYTFYLSDGTKYHQVMNNY